RHRLAAANASTRAPRLPRLAAAKPNRIGAIRAAATTLVGLSPPRKDRSHGTRSTAGTVAAPTASAAVHVAMLVLRQSPSDNRRCRTCAVTADSLGGCGRRVWPTIAPRPVVRKGAESTALPKYIHSGRSRHPGH